MKKFVILLTLFAFLSTIALAQEGKRSEWAIITNKLGDVTAEIPVDTGQTSVKELSKSKDLWGRVGNSYVYTFSYKDNPENDSLPDSIAYAEKLGKKPSASSFAGFDSEDYKFEDDDGFTHMIIDLRANGRRYIFHSVSESISDMTVSRFFAGIKISKAREEKLSEDPLDDEIIGQPREVPAAGQGSGSGSGSGSGGYGAGIGSGRGVASDFGTGPLTPPDKTGNRPFKLLSKPRPGYTDLARTFNITGTVTVRITFLADGTIGAVEPVTKLPFGLTQKAIAAARGIRFEPVMQKSVPYSVTKTLQYTFTIY